MSKLVIFEKWQGLKFGDFVFFIHVCHGVLIWIDIICCSEKKLWHLCVSLLLARPWGQGEIVHSLFDFDGCHNDVISYAFAVQLVTVL